MDLMWDKENKRCQELIQVQLGYLEKRGSVGTEKAGRSKVCRKGLTQQVCIAQTLQTAQKLVFRTDL